MIERFDLARLAQSFFQRCIDGYVASAPGPGANRKKVSSGLVSSTANR
jgi:hypothetical protein